MTTRTGRAGSRLATNAMARPSRSATSGVIGGSLAMPRMPSVPKSLRSSLATGPIERVEALRLVTEVHELELDAKIMGPYRLHTRLQIVPIFPGDPHLSFGNR